MPKNLYVVLRLFWACGSWLYNLIAFPVCLILSWPHHTLLQEGYYNLYSGYQNSDGVCRELLYSSDIAETFAARNQGSLLASSFGQQSLRDQLIISLPIVVGIHDLMPTFQLSCMTRTDTDMAVATSLLGLTAQGDNAGPFKLSFFFFNGDSAGPFPIGICKIQSLNHIWFKIEKLFEIILAFKRQFKIGSRRQDKMKYEQSWLFH